MSSFKNRSDHMTSPLPEQAVLTPTDLFKEEHSSGVSNPATTANGLDQGQSSSRDQQLPFSSTSLSAMETQKLAIQLFTADADQRRTGSLSNSSGGTSSRASVVIKADMKRVSPPVVPPHIHTKRRLIVSLVAVGFLLLITAVTLLSVSPDARDVGMKVGINPAVWGSGNMVGGSNGRSDQLVALATATAVYYQQNDGHDPNSNGGYTISNVSGSLDWPYGQCTYWANLRYHQLTGSWVSWSGDASQWVAGARAAGWNVSTSPHIPSILVMMPYVEGASGYGHVAVAEGYNENVVHTSNMNWWANGGGWGIVSYEDFTLGNGLYFIWK